MNNFSDQQSSRPADNKGWLSRERAVALVLIAATAIALYICYLIALPFIPSIVWATALAVVAYPLHDWILRRINSPNIAAAVVSLVIAVVIIAPGILLGQTLISQIGKGAETLKTQVEQPEQWKSTVESNPKLASVINWIEPHMDVRSIAERAASTAASHVSTFVGGLIWIAAQLAITLFTLFYFLRDKRLIIKTIKSFVPLSQSETDKMFSRLGNTIYATIYGTFAVSLIQGILGGLMFWLLGIPAPVLWGTVMFLASLIPVLGSPVVWIPASIYLALTGDWGKALILAGWGLFVIGSVDNLLYPILVGDTLRLHPLIIFFSVIGGLALIGAAGLVLGPVAVVVTNLLVEVWRQRTSDGNTVEDGVPG
ncbi:MAG TPA: AI-2E family transporter [Pyrinomonadaceae bacterium]|nr:AI-2E family transporter [Pyrinomonadaceae bacterium]